MSERAESPLTAVDPELAADRLVGSLLSRRSLLQRSAVGGGVLMSGGLLAGLQAEAAAAKGKKRGGRRSSKDSSVPAVLQEPDEVTDPVTIFSIATIAEQLAVTLYEEAVEASATIGFTASELETIKAAGIEEQIHHDFFLAVLGLLGQTPGTTVGPTTFTFPANTFTTVAGFVQTQQMLEGVFDSAFLAAIRELSQQGQHRAAQIAGQVACIESEHRALGRQIALAHGITSLPRPFVFPPPGQPSTQRLNLPESNPTPDPEPTSPADEWAFTPVFIETVADAPDVVAAAGFLGGANANPVSKSYEHIDYNSSTYSSVYSRVYFREPIINLGS